ncbi:unnamed protein product, partial [Nesidiocoris tenuis]
DNIPDPNTQGSIPMTQYPRTDTNGSKPKAQYHRYFRPNIPGPSITAPIS